MGAGTPPSGTEQHDQRWTPPAARELPGLREGLVSHLQSPHAHAMLATVLSLGRGPWGTGTISPNTGDPRTDAAILLDEERTRLAQATLYFVTPEMVRLAQVAAQTLPLTTFHPGDVPATTGFCVFGEPIGTYRATAESPTGRNEVRIVAISWGSSRVIPSNAGLWITFWSDTDIEGEIRLTQNLQRITRVAAERQVRSERAELTWDNEMLLYYQPRATWDDVQGTTAVWAHTLRAAWLLMTQPGLAAVDEVPLSRTVRRRALREGLDDSPVRVIRIRQHENVPTRTGQSGNYQVRWTVRGHWRQQWYPSRGEHRQVWINPHIKGPEGAPLQANQTVYVFDSHTPPDKDQ